MVKNIVLNLQIYSSISNIANVPFDDIFGKLIKKLRDSTAYTNGTENQQYTLFLNILCELSTTKFLTENLMVTITESLLNALQNHVQPTEISLTNCRMIIATLRQDQFKCCLRLMLDSRILSILSSKLDWIFGVENQPDLHHQILDRFTGSESDSESEDEYEQLIQNFSTASAFEFQFYDNLDTLHVNNLRDESVPMGFEFWLLHSFANMEF